MKPFIKTCVVLITVSLKSYGYDMSCEECKRRASQCIDQLGYNHCLKMISNCNDICRKKYDVNYNPQSEDTNQNIIDTSEQNFTIQQSGNTIEDDFETKIINDTTKTFGNENIEVRIITKENCGMEKMPGLQIWHTENKIKSGFALCHNFTNYTTMLMEEKNKKVADLGTDYSYVSYKKKTILKAYVVKKKNEYLLKLTLKIPERKKLITKFFDFPFNIVPYEKRIPVVQQIIKKLYSKNEIDRFRIEDLADDLYNVSIRSYLENEQKTYMSFVIKNRDGQINKTITINEIETSKNNTIIDSVLISKKWGPGKQRVRIIINDKKVYLAIWTKTAGKPVERLYSPTELISSIPPIEK